MKILALAAVTASATLAAAASATSQADLDAFARQMGVRLEIVNNRPSACPKGANGCFLSHLDFKVPQSLAADLARGNFKLYFSSVSPVIEAQSNLFQLRHINGDLHLLEPKPGARLQPGGDYRVKLWTQGHFFSAFYPMPNMYLVSGGLEPRIIEATRPVIDRDTGLEELPFVAPMTDEAKLGTAGPGDATRWQTPERAFALYASRPAGSEPELVIIPTPTSATRTLGRPFDLRKGVNLQLTGVARSALEPELARLAAIGAAVFDRGPQLRIAVGIPGIKSEGYRLVAREGLASIEAADPAGAANGLRSLIQQAASEGGTVQPLTIADFPRLPFRGLHLDLARNFHSKQQVLKIIDQMASYKLNRLHLHLGDDEGWRLEIRRFPELTRVGGYRCYDPSEDRCLLPQLGAGPFRETPVNGYLTQEDYRDILRAAKSRHIEVIPSFDMPGHSRAAIRSMEARYRRLIAAGERAEAERFRLVEPEDRTQYRSIQHYTDNTLNVCLDSTYRFLDAVLDEVVAMHAAAGAPLKTYHIGADETAGAWTNSPSCRAVMARTGRSAPQLGAMFIEKVSASLAKRGIAVAGWSDGLGHVDPAKMPRNVQSNIWGDLFTAAPAEASRHAANGWDAVISVPNVLYFDIPYAPHPLERGYDWPARGTDTFKVFSFIPENLAANASVMKNTQARSAKVKAPASIRTAGVQAQLWSETVRSDALVDYMLFPRLLAFAERAWHRASWEPEQRPGAIHAYGDGRVDLSRLQADWSSFAAKLPAHLRQLDRADISYRLAPPGAQISRGMLSANTEFPGQAVEYRTGSGPWQPYQGPVKATAPVELRTLSADRRRTSRVVRVAP